MWLQTLYRTCKNKQAAQLRGKTVQPGYRLKRIESQANLLGYSAACGRTLGRGEATGEARFTQNVAKNLEHNDYIYSHRNSML